MKFLYKFYLFIFLVFFIKSQEYYADFDVVPKPKSLKISNSIPFNLNKNTIIYYNNNDLYLRKNAEFLSIFIKEYTGLNILHTMTYSHQLNNIIILEYNNKIKNDEGYKILINQNSIIIQAKTSKGIFYGINFIRKSLPIIPKKDQNEQINIKLSGSEINDYPSFIYRGLMLDCSRHFFTPEFIKQILDILAFHNMNVFHWHLSDDQGWRIEIKKYPKLTEIASMRFSTVVGFNSAVYDSQPYGGFYLQEEAKEIVQYAKERGIEVIPEIDIPGHTEAILAAYPNLGCKGNGYNVISSWGIFTHILCAGNNEVFNFLEGVIDELIEIFPSKYFNIGGDEAPKGEWENCEKCQKRIKDENIKNSHYLQGYFSNRIIQYLKSKGKRVIGWDEILDGNVEQSAIILSWRSVSNGIEASKKGHDVIFSPMSHSYFDYFQGGSKLFAEPFTIGGNLPLRSVYNFNLFSSISNKEQKKHILGAQANTWSEYLICDNLVMYQILPRLSAMSEVTWMDYNDKFYNEFLDRESKMLKFFDFYGWVYHELDKNNN
jgi:hexosaminidase